MIFILEADIKLLSINEAFSTLRNGRRVRSEAYHKFSACISRLMFNKRNEFFKFNKSFDYKKHEIHAELIYYTDKLYTQDGRISQKSGDLGNVEKCLTDCVLVNEIDDACIVLWSLQKKARDKNGFYLKLEIVDRK